MMITAAIYNSLSSRDHEQCTWEWTADGDSQPDASLELQEVDDTSRHSLVLLGASQSFSVQCEPSIYSQMLHVYQY